MRITSPRLSLFVGVLILASCDRPAIDPFQSLVGAKHLPSASALSHEIIQIGRGFGNWSQGDAGRLFYELRPDDALTITIERYDRKAAKTLIDSKETFRLSPEVASRARQALWRLRPQELKGVQSDTEVADCPPPPTDNSPDFAVDFIAEGPKPGVEDDHVGVFVLRDIRTCNSPKAAEARTIIENVLKSFPASKVAAGHARGMNELEARFRSQPPHPRHP